MISAKNVKHIEFIEELRLNKLEVLIVGSGLLAALGIRKNRDLDLILTNAEFVRIWDKDVAGLVRGVDNYGHPKLRGDLNLPWAGLSIFIDAGINLGVTKERMFDSSTMIGGYRFISKGMLLRWKLKLGRPKDIEDIQLIWQEFNPIWHSIQDL